MKANKQILNEGKSKIIFASKIKEQVIIEFKDDITAFNNQKNEKIESKGQINKAISLICFNFLEKKNIKTHLIADLTPDTILCRALSIFQIEVVIRNIVAGSLKNRIGLEEGQILKYPICELYYKNDHLNDPLLNEEHIKYLNLAQTTDIQIMKQTALNINFHLKSLFSNASLVLVDFKLEFGKQENTIYLADEISPDTCRIWQKENLKILDKDRFRKNIGNVKESYEQILNQLKKTI